jgi:hypothetical protein
MYCFIAKTMAKQHGNKIRKSFSDWLKKWKEKLSKQENKYLKHAVNDEKSEPVSMVYFTMKIHKTPLKTRPIFSYNGTPLYSKLSTFDLKPK